MSKEQANVEAVDFDNPESIEEELAAVAAVPTKEKKEAKPKMVKVTCPNCATVFDFEIPKSISSRGAVVGIALSDMTVDQLKIEYRNANSVAYKSKKANKNPDTIAKSAARLEAVKAEMELRGIQPTSRGPVAVDAQAIAKLIAAGAVTVEEIQKFLNDAATPAQ